MDTFDGIMNANAKGGLMSLVANKWVLTCCFGERLQCHCGGKGT